MFASEERICGFDVGRCVFGDKDQGSLAVIQFDLVRSVTTRCPEQLTVPEFDHFALLPSSNLALHKVTDFVGELRLWNWSWLWSLAVKDTLLQVSDHLLLVKVLANEAELVDSLLVLTPRRDVHAQF